jgi:hypothetical protein
MKPHMHAHTWEGLSSQLSKLTCLRTGGTPSYDGGLTRHQLYNFRDMTALQQLSVKGGGLDLWEVFKTEQLVHLTAIEFDCPGLYLCTGWSMLTGLQSFTMTGGNLQPSKLSKFPQLQALCLDRVRLYGDVLYLGQQLQDLLAVVPQLSLLTQLSTIRSKDLGWALSPPADAFTALVASSNLCSLRLGLEAAKNTPEQWVLFAPDMLYPFLRVINLTQLPGAQDVPISEQQLQHLCSCCPAVQELSFALCEDATPTALQPLLQLSALTSLEVYRVGAAAAGVLWAAAHLTGLKRLNLRDIPVLADHTVLQLTALTGLRQLSLWQVDMEECWESEHEVGAQECA